MRKKVTGLVLRAMLSALGFFGALLLALSFPANAQQPPKVAKIGVLADVNSPPVEALRQGLRDLGYIEGQNILIEYRYAEGKRDRLPDYAAELIRQKVDLIVAVAQAVHYAAKSVKDIPVVFGFSGDAVDAGLVASLARPGANVTGMSFFASTLAGKRVELLKEALPGISRIAVLANPGHAGIQIELRETQTVARALGMSVQYQTAQVSNDFSPAFDAIAKYRVNALITFPDGVMLAHRQEIAEFAAKQRLASVSGWSEFADAGGLMTYGPNFLNSWRQVAVFVDKILKGAKPADLPVEQPTKFELVINLKAAKQIGVTIPPNVLARADKVIK
jgi:putative ABC transport system substrate-binding protein